MFGSITNAIRIGAVLVTAPFALLASDRGVSPKAAEADVLFLGETHDNPVHHETQAEWVAALSPAALVFEMLTPDLAARVTPAVRGDPSALADALEWHSSGWPDFEMYYPIFAAAPQAQVFGAGVRRSQIQGMMTSELIEVVGAGTAARFGLDQPLPDDQQALRENLQAVAHCDALPKTFLPRMVDVQRLRDATLANVALDALKAFGPPVVVITGNGHAREDWGAPALLRLADPSVAIFSLGQGEAGTAPNGGYTLVLDAPSVDRGDPCAAFTK
ncbi:MAG: ChaN family lipoprotein [Pseudomonadota bacterium]